MDLNVRDSARLLKVSEKTIYRWVQQGKLPAYRVNEQYRFNRAELLEWATSQRLNVSPEIFVEPAGSGGASGLGEAIRAGGIYYRVSGADKSQVLRAVVDLMPLPDLVDRQFLLQVLLARESLGSTAVGNGIALPHVRNPVVMHVQRPTLAGAAWRRSLQAAKATPAGI
jgi:PTS system nitrogen regulatory IIA component